MKAILKTTYVLMAVSFLLGFSSAARATVASTVLTPNGYLAATPTVYKVTVKSIEFYNGATWSSFFSGTCVMDIAAVATGASAGGCGAGGTLSPGTYTQMRITILDTFTVKGSITNAGSSQACWTSAGNGTITSGIYTLNAGSATAGSTTVGTVTEQSVRVPVASDGSINTALSNSSMPRTGNNMVMTISGINLVIPEGQPTAPSGFAINFKVENTLYFLTTGAGTCTVTNGPPVITVVTPSGNTSYAP